MAKSKDPFVYHAPTPEQVGKMKVLRDSFKALRDQIVELVPDGRERAVCLTHLQQSMMMANAQIMLAIEESPQHEPRNPKLPQ